MNGALYKAGPGDTAGKLLSVEDSLALDAEAAASWGLDSFALVEAAGRSCAAFFVAAYSEVFAGAPRVAAFAGGGNNGADALVMLRSLILTGKLVPANAVAILSASSREQEYSPRSQAVLALEKMGVPALVWGEDACRRLAAQADIIIDGITGTGLRGPLRGAAEDMARYVNSLENGAEIAPGAKTSEQKVPFTVSIDVPSGCAEYWEQGMPVLRAGATLAIEPLKECLFRPALRPFAGMIIPVAGIFPAPLIDAYSGAELLSWNSASRRIPPIPQSAYKHERGVVEIRAGSPGFPGAARIAGQGAQAAGAGLIRLIADEAIYPILAVSAGGIMIVPAASALENADRFIPDAILLGPGWGRSPDRPLLLDRAAEREASGTPLILDADAIALAGDRRFHGRTILTPHPGEFAAYAGVSKEKALENPGPLISALARERGAVVVFKGHVIYIACPQGRVGVVDGMSPVLAAGGSGDLLAGFCAALAARTARLGIYDGYVCAAAAVALLIETGRVCAGTRRFLDPLELADTTAALAGAAWLPADKAQP
jgi:NAD(P)H-hydrate epimerase